MDEYGNEDENEIVAHGREDVARMMASSGGGFVKLEDGQTILVNLPLPWQGYMKVWDDGSTRPRAKARVYEKEMASLRILDCSKMLFTEIDETLSRMKDRENSWIEIRRQGAGLATRYRCYPGKPLSRAELDTRNRLLEAEGEPVPRERDEIPF